MSRPEPSPQVCSTGRVVAATAAGADGRLVNLNDDVRRAEANYHGRPQVHAESTRSHTTEMAGRGDRENPSGRTRP
jgi:hypothetical protein